MVYNDGNVSRYWEENCCLNQKLALAGKKNEIILLRDKEKKNNKTARTYWETFGWK